jgi:putative DNA primase/helicase
MLEELASKHHKDNIIEMIKDLTLADRKDFNVDKNLINLNNGVFNIKNKELMPHNHEYLFFTKIPIDYNINATCPLIQKFMNEILPEENKKIILEWFGYCLYRCYFIKKAMILVGEKDTGKSTVIKLFERFVGKENASGVSLQKMTSDKFASSHLYNKHINVYDDLSFRDINDNGQFKIATGGSVMTGEKKFGEQFQFENFSKLTFACNKIPDVKDTNDDAYFSRWIIIPFLAEIEKIDKFLTEKITTKEELSGLLNLAILGLNEILEKQDFSYDKAPEEIKKEMLLSGSMIANFVNDRLEKHINAWVSKDNMYEEYANYAQSNGLPTIDKPNLGRKLPNHSGYITDGTKLIGKKQTQGWRNVKIKGKEEEEG